jgi:Holliday junction resolvase-like predicted endonuclease
VERHGLIVIDRNVRVGRGEIDLLADDHGRRVAIEVKTVVAVGDDPFLPEDAFTDEKAHTVRRLAEGLSPRAVRVDLVAISLIDSGARIRWLRSVC